MALVAPGTLENGAPYMVMEYLDGGDLAARIQQRGPLPSGQTRPLRALRLPPPPGHHHQLTFAPY
ncbi:MAG TPA: hypothetical protein VGY54_05625 [Polyangiaceae bacterium]|nr:hypothetical protein [Polyangiaceae bacterium]